MLQNTSSDKAAHNRFALFARNTHAVAAKHVFVHGSQQRQRPNASANVHDTVPQRKRAGRRAMVAPQFDIKANAVNERAVTPFVTE